ncbi:MAG: hypothetical protein K8S21_13110 [Gemmatimonadetes bacterium]|nr:hypothetical protein [Gemmatimonadota bacterium]
MKRLPWFAGAVVAIALGTWVVGWWIVPIVGAAWGWVKRTDPATPLLAGVAGMLAWAILLVVSANGAPAGSVSATVGQAMRVGPGALVALTLAYPGLLAASGAALARAVGRRGR